MNQEQKLKWIKRLTWLFIIGLFLSGATAIPLKAELNVLANLLGGTDLVHEAKSTGLTHWILKVREALRNTDFLYPFMAYGTDWLAFGHFAIALAFVGPLRDPVRNRWLYQFGMISCVLVIPYAMIFGAVRGIPFYWRLIDCSFGVFGFIPPGIAGAGRGSWSGRNLNGTHPALVNDREEDLTSTSKNAFLYRIIHMKRPAFPVDVSKMKMHTFWFVAIAAALCGCAEEKSEVIYQPPVTSPGGVFATLPPAVQNPVLAEAGMAEISNAAAIKAEGLKLTIETSNSTYRVSINPGTNTVEYDKRSFQAPTPGLCPAGAFAYLKNDRDAYLGCGQKEYSSANMSSQISLGPDYASLSGTNDFVSGPWEILQILGGINLCADVDSIPKIKLGFRVGLRVNGVERRYVAETDWSTASPELIKALK